jgi:hypothetical protein
MLSKLRFSMVAFGFASMLVPTLASAEEVVVVEEGRPRHRERYYEEYDRGRPMAVYPVELEAHFAFGPDNIYGNGGYGAGARVSIPLVAGVMGPRMSDNFALSFGADVLHYDNCYYTGRCSANYLMVPAAAQWNIFFGRRLSVFGEAGAFFYRGFFDECVAGDVECAAPRDVGVLPTLAVGVRGHITRDVAIIGRLGYPTSTVGVSFM